MRFLSYDSKFGQIFLKVAYSCCLNVLWFICCLPIFTIGASTTALYYTSFKIAKNEGSFITTMFFRSFKQNFKQATLIWLIMLGTGILLVVDGVLAYRLRETNTGTAAILWTLLLAVIIGGSILYLIVLTYVFPLLSIVSNSTANMFKNSFIFGTHYLFTTLIIFFIHYAMFFLVVNVFTPLIIFGEGLCALLSAKLLLKVLYRHIYGEPKIEEPADDPTAKFITHADSLTDSSAADDEDPADRASSYAFFSSFDTSSDHFAGENHSENTNADPQDADSANGGQS
jgi:uncharacterized membrane protein YesL